MKKIASYFLLILIVICLLIVSMMRSDIPVQELKTKYTNEHSKFIKINGMQVHYTDEGQGTPLILLHGIGSSLNTWDGWEEELKANFRIIRLDLPGFALTGPNPTHEYSIEFYVSFIKSFLDALTIDACYMTGSSLGGYITWNVASAHPNLVKKMILIDAAGYPFTNDTTPFVFKVAQTPIAPLFKNTTPRFLIAHILKQVYGDDSKITDSVIDRYYDYARGEGNRGAFLDVVKSLQFTQYQKIKNIKTPTLLLWGAKDTWIEPQLGKRFHQDLPNSKLIMYPGVGHIPMEELPKQTAADAQLFLLGTSSNANSN